jgi:ribosomal protein L11 methyltransferase
MPLLALTLKIAADAAEAMSDALLEAGAQSVSVDDLERAYVTLLAHLAADADAATLVDRAARSAGLVAAPPYAVQSLPEQDWVRASQAQFAPIEVGARLWVGPSWHVPPADRACVRLDPGLAFGTGSHPTTRLVLDFLERTVGGGESVLDYGCGSGILAIAAAKLGAAHVDALDTDPQAVETAAANALANRVTLRAALPEALPVATYDVVVSNILAQPLIVLAPLLAARAAPKGRIALAGLLESQAAEVAQAYAPWFSAAVEARREGWALVVGTRQ